MSRRAADDGHENCRLQLEATKARLDHYIDRIDRLADAHSPKVDAHLGQTTRSDTGSYSDSTVLWCNECRSPWPCSSYLWATGSAKFKVVIRRPEDDNTWGFNKPEAD